MKKDPIAQLVKESGLKTSPGFTDLTMEKLDRRIQLRIKIKLGLLMTAVVLLGIFVAYRLISAQFSIVVFGLLVELPKIVTMVGISMTCYLMVLHLNMLVRMNSLR